MFYKGSPAQAAVRQMYEQRMAECIKDERLLRGIIAIFAFVMTMSSQADEQIDNDRISAFVWRGMPQNDPCRSIYGGDPARQRRRPLHGSD